LGLCSAGTRDALSGFAALHFARLTSRYAYSTSARNVPAALSAADSWHLFETHLMVNSTRQGKRYKDWLLERSTIPGAEACEALTAGAVLVMRDAVREHLRREYEPDWMLSLNAPAADAAGETVSFEDLLPGGIDPSDEVATREFERLAAARAEEFFQEVGLRERIIVLARELGLSLAHPEVERTAGCRKSVLGEAYRACFARLARRLAVEYAAEDAEALRILTLMTFQELGNVVRAWSVSNAGCAGLLSAAGGSG